MHMRPQPCQEPIVPAEPSAATQLWQRLNAPAWPLPLSALPAGSALVGGAVRDALLGRLAPQPDIDVVVPGGAIPLCRSLARRLGGSAVVLDQERDIARLVLQGWCFDLAAREGDCLSVDLQRRDYSINAIALPLAPGTPLLDPTGGLASLQRRELVAISEANLLSDPLRLLRGLRLASELGFSIAAETWGWIAQHRATLQAVAGERVLAELQKLACAPDGAHGLGQVLQSGLLDPWLGPGIALHEPLARLTPAGAAGLHRRWGGPGTAAQQPGPAEAGAAAAPALAAAGRPRPCGPAGERALCAAPRSGGRSAGPVAAAATRLSAGRAAGALAQRR
jgi:tRNA nucleotidyltransferase (CCA-adding enzyme)